MCTITRGLAGFDQLIPMLVLLSCRYRECVHVRLQQQKIRNSLKVRKRAQEPRFFSQVDGGFRDQRNKHLYLLYLC